MKISKLAFSIFFLVSAIEAIFALAWLASIPAEVDQAILLGFSVKRLLLMTVLIICAGLSLWLGLFISRKPVKVAKLETISKNSFFRWMTAGLLAVSWIGIFLPADQWSGLAGYKERLLPAVCWVFLVTFQTLVFIAVKEMRGSGFSWKKSIQSNPILFRAWGFFFGLIACGVLVIAVFRIGLIPDIVYWNDMNVPLLGLQILGVAAGCTALLVIMSKTGFFSGRVSTESRNQQVLSEIVICLLIWAFAVVLWTQVEMPRSFFSPGPYPPNGEMYPFSDAAGYDTASHIAVIGEGLGTQTYVDKPLYVAFLTLIHLIVGNRMQAVVGLQVAVIGLLPVVIYLLGKKTHSRLAGLMAAGFVVFREVNNIQGTLWVLSTNSRVLMSESLVTLLLAASMLFFANWLAAREKTEHLMASGGFLGLAALVRLNPFILLPVALLVIFVVCWKRWKRAFVNCILFSMFFGASVFPWMFQSWIRHDNFIFFRSTVRWVVLPQRTFYSLNAPPPAQPSSEPIVQEPQQPVNKTWNRITGISRYVSAHFTHNLVSTAAIFPTRLRMDSLEQMIKTPGSFWSPEWEGNLPPGETVLLWTNLLIISLGLASAWERRRWAGLVPAGFLLSYSLATAAARTSGGRYIMPADWVGLFYFALGLSHLVGWITVWLDGEKHNSIFDLRKKISSNPFSIPKIAILLGVFLLVGATPVILDYAIPRRYAMIEKSTLPAEFENSGLLKSLQITTPELISFINSPNAVFYYGRGLYPRYYGIDKGEPDRFSAARGQPFPRLVMKIVGPEYQISGVLPLMDASIDLPNGSDVLAIGCEGELNDDWLALVVEGDERRVYLRSPATEWKCPVSLPTCDNNRNCW